MKPLGPKRQLILFAGLALVASIISGVIDQRGARLVLHIIAFLLSWMVIFLFYRHSEGTDRRFWLIVLTFFSILIVGGLTLSVIYF